MAVIFTKGFTKKSSEIIMCHFSIQQDSDVKYTTRERAIQDEHVEYTFSG